MTAYVFKRVKDYYKYEYQDWTQPVLTANGTMGGNSFAASQVGFADEGDLKAFRAFDNNTSTMCYFAKSTGYLQWYNPNPLKITNLKLTNFVGDSWGTRALTSGSIQVSNNGSDFVELKTFTNSATGGGASWNIDLSANTGYYKYYRIVCTGTSYAVANAANQCHIAELKITATEQITVKGSATDYDFRTSKAYVLKRKRPTEYRKKVIDTATAGTYTFDVAKDTTARIILVGGGGAGGQVWVGHAEGSGGGSGACVYCKVKLNAGTYTITNGAAGVFPRGNAGNSTLSLGDTTLITAAGGTGGQDSGGPVGVGGTYSFADGVEIEKIFFASNGNNGVVGGNMWGGTGGASVYKGYGAGGNSRTGGNAGYIWVELTTDESDYDYKIDNDACYALKRKQYWKYEYQDWTQPVLTANGTMGGSSFAVRGSNPGSEPYLGYDGNSSTWFQLSTNIVNETFFYNPNPLKVSKLSFVYYPTTWITSGEVYGSNNDVDYVLLATFSHSADSGSVDVNNEVGYKYFKIKVLAANGSDGSQRVLTDFYSINITAQEGIPVEATKDDYDFITD